MTACTEFVVEAAAVWLAALVRFNPAQPIDTVEGALRKLTRMDGRWRVFADGGRHG